MWIDFPFPSQSAQARLKHAMDKRPEHVLNDEEISQGFGRVSVRVRSTVKAEYAFAQ